MKARNPKENLSRRYRALDAKVKIDRKSEREIRADVLLAIPYWYRGQPAEVSIDSEEFSALCPWTGLPDQGSLAVRYVPREKLLELKSLKFYLLSFRQVGIVQEHAAARILKDLVAAVRPRRMQVRLDYRPRGGLHTVVTVEYPVRRK
ncbi:MAG: NADPH-dependent 7-cyano-7-deazaguanine reductase QueF [Myxococcales bacterium]|nr:NADPH-dependent 7-cyano-7-deazaguanine reductase QueF [Myxococcales bacterium]